MFGIIVRKGVCDMQGFNKIAAYSLENKRYLCYSRIPVAVHCWYPTGDDNAPFITMMKFREPEGEVVTVKDIFDQQLDFLCTGGAAITEIKCQILYQNRKREVVVFFYPKQLKWEMCFLC